MGGRRGIMEEHIEFLVRIWTLSCRAREVAGMPVHDPNPKSRTPALCDAALASEN